MNIVKTQPKSITTDSTKYCPGCGHGIILRLIGEAIDELGIRERMLLTAPVGCAVVLYDYIFCDVIECAHGRAPAVGTALKRVHPDKFVLIYQGDGDLAAIGTAEIIHAANRGENMSVIFVNNATYGMTGGQMAPTTLVGQKTTTCPSGRTIKGMGKPIRVCEMLSTLEETKYLERTSINSVRNINKTKAAIRKVFQNQLNGIGFSMVEILSMCPVGWKVSPVEAVQFIEEQMLNYFPLGVYKNVE
ncbi:MAG: 2-oxoglutarate oxidoreductase [Planctomycetes bacterium GWF2_41_51]|nr:MAG: 2-oxoglutarate oxidoreductase [Planctomycetes bacterium GWF2_41_51]HBG27002.1 2-oxoglutarate oxidoreductase [Phycisphaerales bacterium]